MPTKTFDPKQVSVVFGGAILGAFADGTFIEVEREEDTFTMKVGAGGEVCRVKSNNRSGKATFTCMQDSETNDILSQAYANDELVGDGISDLFISEANGSTAVHSGEAWISKPPKMSRGKEHVNVEWVLGLASVDIFNGGLF